MTPAQLSRTVLTSVRRAVQAGELRADVPERAGVRRPPRPGCGDYATGIALELARRTGRTPLQVAEILRVRLARTPGIERVDVAEPGFLNITLAADAHQGLVRTVLAEGMAYGHGDAYAQQRVELSYPDHLRAAVTADALARVFRAQAADVVTLLPDGRPDPPAGRPRADQGPAPPSVTVTVRPVPVQATADELLRTLGADAARWALLRPAAHDHPRTDPAELLAQRERNPLFRVQYAHARAVALVRNGARLGVPPDPSPVPDPGPALDPGPAPEPCLAHDPSAALDPRPAQDPAHAPTYASPQLPASPQPSASPQPPALADLLGALGEYPRVLADAARLRAPDRVARHLEATADAFFRFHDTCPVLPRGDEKPSDAHRARVALTQAAGTVLAGGLHLLGITAPAHI